ncbi:MAG: zinc ribbon domain-containing protein [Methanoregula sp.]|jgi:hypothetical protein
MGRKFCTVCGAALPEEIRSCEKCGSPVVPDSTGRIAQPAGLPSAHSPEISSPHPGKNRTVITIIGGIFLILVIVAGMFIFVLPALPGTDASRGLVPGPATTTQTVMPVVTTPIPASPAPTSVQTQKPDPFPGALRLKERFSFGSEKVASEATVYKYWINDTYQWHNDKDNNFYVQSPGAGNKYLFVFVHLENTGDTRVWFPSAGNVVVYNNGIRYYQDQNHYKPNKGSNLKATPIEVREIQYSQKLNGDEYAEDFGFSHGTELGFLYPGTSNAVDGYIIYEVPKSLIPEETYVAIPFNGQDQGVWKLG